MAKVVRDPDGGLWEERDGKWYEVKGARAGGMLAAEGMGPVTGALVGAGRELTSWGRNARSAVNSLLGDEAMVAELARRQADDTARVEGTKAVGPSSAISIGEMLPGLATAPIGMTARGAAAALPYVGRVGTQLAGQAGVGGVTGYLGSHSGDAGMDSMVGALLGAGGWGGGQLAGKVVGAIRNSGAATRLGIADEQARAAGVGAPVPGGAGMGGIAGPPAPPGMSGTGNVLPESAEDVLRFGAAARPGAEDLIAGKGLPGQMAGTPGLTQEETRQLARFDELGFKVTPGTRTGSLPQKQIEAGLQRVPETAGAFEGMFKHNRDNLNRLAVRAIGEEGTEVAPSVLDAAHSRIGKVFNAAGELMGTMKAGDEVVKEASARLSGIIARETEGGAVVPEVASVAKRLMGIWGEGGQVTGERLMRERSRYVKLARGFSSKGDGLAADGIHDVISVIDDMVADAVPASGRQALREVRAQWRILRAMEGGGVLDAAGNVRSGAFFQGLTREFPLEMRRGVDATSFGGTQTGKKTRDLMDAVRASQTFRQAIPDSGTATGMAMQGLEGSMLRRILGGLITHTGGRLYLGGGGQAASALMAAPSVLPGAAGAAGAVGRAGGAGGILGDY